MVKKAIKSKTVESLFEGQSGQKASPERAISKAEAVRQALAAGMDAPADGVEFIKSNYDIDMENQTFSSYKAQQKARDMKRAAEAEAEPGRKLKASRSSLEGYLSPPPKIIPTGEGDLLDVMETMKPLIAQYGADRLKRIVDLLG